MIFLEVGKVINEQADGTDDAEKHASYLFQFDIDFLESVHRVMIPKKKVDLYCRRRCRLS